MIPADRERLSLILKRLDHVMPIDPAGWPEPQELIDAARAIVDQPASPNDMPNIIVNVRGAKIGDPEALRSAVKAAFTQAPNPTLDAFLTTPIHEYRDHIPTRRRHRAIRPITLATALTLAAIGLIAATALTAPQVSTDRPNPQTRPAKPPSEAAETVFRPGDAPWNTTRRPGTPGNGLGVATP